jgi:hypothetical protein
MKTRILAVLMLAAAAAVFARPPMGPGWGPHPFPIQSTYLRAELDSLLAESGGEQPAALTLSELQALAGRLSVARQKDRFVARSQAMSFMAPGTGQMLNKAYGAGAGFLAADLTVVAGTLIGAYYLAPANLQFQHLDYFNTPFNTIRDTWEGHTFMDYLPSMAVLAGGALAKTILGRLSSAHAGRLARRNIEEGKVNFEPNLLVLPHGGMMMVMGWRY